MVGVVSRGGGGISSRYHVRVVPAITLTVSGVTCLASILRFRLSSVRTVVDTCVAWWVDVKKGGVK